MHILRVFMLFIIFKLIDWLTVDTIFRCVENAVCKNLEFEGKKKKKREIKESGLIQSSDFCSVN